VTRAINFLDLTRNYKAELTHDTARSLLSKKLFGVLASSASAVDKWEKQVRAAPPPLFLSPAFYIFFYYFFAPFVIHFLVLFHHFFVSSFPFISFPTFPFHLFP
jgi:hypothetical protein